MAKAIDSNNIWYQEVSPRSFYNENDLERAIVLNLHIIFPQFEAVPFKKKLFDSVRSKNNTPDLAMVKKDYSEWYIIEVELGKHNKSHVVDQIQSFYNAGYLEEHADYIHSNSSTLDRESLRAMVSKVPPDFMVIVNEPKLDWINDLRKLRCKTCVFQVYHDFTGRSLFRLNGEHPFIFTKFCHCKYQKTLPYAIEILDTNFLNSYSIFDTDEVHIDYNGMSFKWARKDSGTKVFLICNNDRPPLDPLTDRYRLNFDASLNSFSFTKD